MSFYYNASDCQNIKITSKIYLKIREIYLWFCNIFLSKCTINITPQATYKKHIKQQNLYQNKGVSNELYPPTFTYRVFPPRWRKQARSPSQKA